MSNSRYALRMLRLNPGFAAVAIITLALGIGATTAMFTVVDGVVLKALRYPDADRIVAVNTRFTNEARNIWRTAGDDVTDLRNDKDVFEAFTDFAAWEMGVQFNHGAEYVQGCLADTDFLHVFAIAPIAGRGFLPEDADRAALVSEGFAQRNFGSPAAAMGKTLSIEARTYDIVGVMPGGFDFPRSTQIWAATALIPENHSRTAYNYRIAAKLKPGLSLAAANSQLDTLGAHLAEAYPDSNKNKTFRVTPLQDQLTAPVRSTLFILMGAVALVLLIACANVANLMLARSAARSRELAVRAALGAGRRKLISMLLAESIVLAVIAGACGIAIAAWSTNALLALGARFLPPPLVADIKLDWRVLAFAAAASLVTSVLFGIAPAWRATRVNLQDELKQGGSRGLLGSGPTRLRSTLVVAQIALSLMLAVGAGLLFRTLLALHAADLGFRSEGVLIAYTHVPAKTTAEAVQAGQFLDDAVGRLRHLPGVLNAADGMGVPTGDVGSNGGYAVEGKQSWPSHGGVKLPHADFDLAGPGYFAALGIPVVHGREFTDADGYGRPPVVIISQSVARQQFGNEDPLGHRIFAGLDEGSDKGMTVVGVVGDVRQDSPAEAPGPALYMPMRQHPFFANQAELVLRTSGDAGLMIPQVQGTIHDMNAEVPMKFVTLAESVNQALTAERFRTALASSFAILALLLALSGMYAVMSYVTARRTSEFGLRSALGANPGSILGLVLSSALKLGATGVIAGLVLSFIGTRLLSTMLFGLKATDPATYLLVTAVVLPVIVLAAALPAWRASRVDPMIALRNE